MTRDTVTKIATPAVGPALMYSGDAEVSFVARSALNHLPPYSMVLYLDNTAEIQPVHATRQSRLKTAKRAAAGLLFRL
ncbi:hypothetical protein VTN31DRAFT_5291 [Thermomyces dupontii]|uniref:uncharacterized protein n=1 Tax=Talaromyces thermophilus TaxID=28565 RepID=UPI00374364B3